MSLMSGYRLRGVGQGFPIGIDVFDCFLCLFFRLSVPSLHLPSAAKILCRIWAALVASTKETGDEPDLFS